MNLMVKGALHARLSQIRRRDAHRATRQSAASRERLLSRPVDVNHHRDRGACESSRKQAGTFGSPYLELDGNALFSPIGRVYIISDMMYIKAGMSDGGSVRSAQARSHRS